MIKISEHITWDVVLRRVVSTIFHSFNFRNNNEYSPLMLNLKLVIRSIKYKL
jgi:hypothetical protein